MSRASELKYGSHYGRPGETVPQVVNLQRAAHCVAMRQPFEANQCKGLWVQQRMPYRELHDELISEITARRNYIVLTGSTDYSLPLFVYDQFAEAWFENSDSLYGSTTTKQRKRLRPQGEVHEFDNVTLHAISQFGYAHVAKLRLERKGKRPWQEELRAYVSAHGGTATGRWNANVHPTMQELVREWRKKHVVNGGPSLNQIYDELVKLKSGGKVP